MPTSPSRRPRCRCCARRRRSACPSSRESILEADVLPGILAALRPASPSPALQRAFDLAAAGRFVDLMVEEPVPAAEEGVRAALRGTGAAVGRRCRRGGAVSARAAARRAARRDARAVRRGPRRCSHAMPMRSPRGRKRSPPGAPRALVAPHLLDAYLRRGDYTRAAAVAVGQRTARRPWSRGTAAVLIATQKEARGDRDARNAAGRVAD